MGTLRCEENQRDVEILLADPCKSVLEQFMNRGPDMTYLPKKLVVDADRFQMDVYDLSKPDAVSAYIMLMISYRHRGRLPSDDDTVRRRAEVSPKKWPAVREELRKIGFTDDWRFPKWDAVIAKEMAREQRLAARKRVAA
jgi:uncharacterized protein YdaU (DUF1376 family)